MRRNLALSALALVTPIVFILSCQQANNTPKATSAYKLPFKFTSKTIQLPQSHRTFTGGAIAQVANQYCLMCHSMGMISRQPPFDRKTWLAEVSKMRTAYYCPLPEDQVSKLADFLYKQNHRPDAPTTAALR
jgi:hypothetical protein